MSPQIAAVVAMLAAGYASLLAGKLVRAFPSFEAYCRASGKDFDPAVFSKAETEKLLARDLPAAEKIVRECDNKAIGILSYFDPAYPPLLRELKDPPPVLFTRGQPLPDFSSAPSISLVGTKSPTPKYCKFAALNAFSFAVMGFRLVSGFTVGIESYVHKGYLFGGGHPVAVLPCGLDVFPSGGDEKVLGGILRKGTLLSEYPPGYPVRLWSYSKRNRLVSGMTQGTLVVEASVNSGAISTATYAKEQGRALFAVPSEPYEPSSEGNNVLIREGGARLVSSFLDVVEDYNRLFGYHMDVSIHEKELRKGFEGDSAIVLTNKEVEEYRNSVSHTKKPARKTAASRRAYSPLLPENTPVAPAEKPSVAPVTEESPLSPEESAVLALLKKGSVTADGLCEEMGISFPEAIDLLSRLTDKGLCRETEGGRYEG